MAAYLFWLGGQGLDEAAATMTAGRSSQPKLPVIAAATGDLLGAAEPALTLSAEQRAAVATKLAQL